MQGHRHQPPPRRPGRPRRASGSHGTQRRSGFADRACQNQPDLARATSAERQTLYEITYGNPLLLRWTVGQLGRQGSQCYTVAEACEYLKHAPKNNDPLEYIFGDLLDTFTDSETAVLAALTHFTQPAKVKWIADVAGIAERQAETALEDLAGRALLVGDPTAQSYLLPPLATHFLRARRPEAVTQTGDRLTNRVYALALENGYKEYDRFPALEAEWPTITAALPNILKGYHDSLQIFCDAIFDFLNFSGRWDEWLWLSQQAEIKAIKIKNFEEAGRRAYDVGYIYYLRGQADEVLACANRIENHSKAINGWRWAKFYSLRLRVQGLRLQKDFSAAIITQRQLMELKRAIFPDDKYS